MKIIRRKKSNKKESVNCKFTACCSLMDGNFACNSEEEAINFFASTLLKFDNDILTIEEAKREVSISLRMYENY